MDRSKLKCEYCKSTGRHVTNNYCKELNKGRGKDDKEVAKKIVSKPGTVNNKFTGQN